APPQPSSLSLHDALSDLTCVAACPFGVIERRADGTAAPGERGPQRGPTREGGIAQKCTLCYDRLTDGQQPACAQTCPTESITFRSEEHTSELQSRFDLVC